MYGFENGCGVFSFFHFLLSYFYHLNNYETIALGGLSREMGIDVSSELLDAESSSLFQSYNRKRITRNDRVIPH